MNAGKQMEGQRCECQDPLTLCARCPLTVAAGCKVGLFTNSRDMGFSLCPAPYANYLQMHMEYALILEKSICSCMLCQEAVHPLC